MQIKEEANEKGRRDISRTIQRNVSNYFTLVAVSPVFNAHHKEKSGKIMFSIFVYDTGRNSLIKKNDQGRCFRSLEASLTRATLIFLLVKLFKLFQRCT